MEKRPRERSLRKGFASAREAKAEKDERMLSTYSEFKARIAQLFDDAPAVEPNLVVLRIVVGDSLRCPRQDKDTEASPL